MNVILKRYNTQRILVMKKQCGKYGLLLCLLLAPFFSAYAQKLPIFDPAEINDSVKLICISYLSSGKTNCYIQELKTIREFASNVFLGKKHETPSLDSKSTEILLVKNKAVFRYWTYWPSGKNIMMQDKCYDFDIGQLDDYCKKFNFSYERKLKEFQTMEGYNHFVDSILNVQDIIYYDPLFSYYDGKFFVEVPCNNNIPNVNSAIHKVKEEIGLTNNEDVEIGYPGDMYNITHQGILYRLEIQCSYERYKKYTPVGCEKSEWIPAPYKVKVKYYSKKRKQ